jgi:hypothetical protein
VPTGTVIVWSSPPLPYISLPLPFSPRCARKVFSWRKSTSVLRFSSACSQTLPPLPPSPPLGPPSGMNFSRRKLMDPSPPLPAITVMSASSTSFISLAFLAAETTNPAGAGLVGHRRAEVTRRR